MNQDLTPFLFFVSFADYLPAMYPDMVEAWDRLDDEWQDYIRIIKRDYQHLVAKERQRRYCYNFPQA